MCSGVITMRATDLSLLHGQSRVALMQLVLLVVSAAVNGPGLGDDTVNDPVFWQTAVNGSGFGNATVTSPGFGEATVNGPGFEDAAVNGPDFEDAAVNGPGFGDAAVNGPGFGDAAVNGPGFGDAAVNEPGFGDAAVNGPGFGDAAVNGPGFGDAAVNGPGFGDAAVNGPGFGDAAVNGPGFGDAAVNGPGFGDAAVNGPGFGDAAVNGPGFGDAAVNGPGFGDAAVNGPGFGDAAVNGPGFGDAAVNGPGFGDAAVNGPGFGDAAVNGPGFGDAAVNGPGFGDVAVNGPGFGEAEVNGGPGLGDSAVNGPGFGDVAVNGPGFGNVAVDGPGLGGIGTVVAIPSEDCYGHAEVSSNYNMTDIWNIWEVFLAKAYHRDGDRAVANESQSNSGSCSADIPTMSKEFGLPMMDMSLEQCPESHATVFTASRGIISGLTWNSSDDASERPCRLTVVVPVGSYVLLGLRAQGIRFDFESEQLYETFNGNWMRISESNQASFSFVVPQTRWNEELRVSATAPAFDLLFLATQTSPTRCLRVESTTSLWGPSGHITSPTYGFALAPKFMNAAYTVRLPEGHVLMLSFPRFSLLDKLVFSTMSFPAGDLVTLSAVDTHGAVVKLWEKTGEQDIPPKVYNTSIRVHFKTEGISCFGFKVRYSFHPLSAVPTQDATSGLWDCSRPDLYRCFQLHVHCNLHPDCRGGEDEGAHCPFSSPACDGHFAVGDDKCYVYTAGPQPLSWSQARERCQQNGGDLAVVKDDQQLRAFQDLFMTAKNPLKAFVGLTILDTVPNMYRNVWQWLDGTVGYRVKLITRARYQEVGFNPSTPDIGFVLKETHVEWTAYVCENKVTMTTGGGEGGGGGDSSNASGVVVVVAAASDPMPSPVSLASRLEPSPALISCPTGHLTHVFLACDALATCRVRYFARRCSLSVTYLDANSNSSSGSTNTSNSSSSRAQITVTGSVRLFECETQGQTIPYTLVCNFADDCWDGSDERFCRHTASCEEGFLCDSGQCLTRRFSHTIHFGLGVCDRVSDCYDNTEERGCRTYVVAESLNPELLSGRVDFTSRGIFEMQALSSPEMCPRETHFQCLGDADLCLPVYVRCNDVNDCPGHEDEMGCGDYTCPGYYRCRDSRVCVHVTNVCDGVNHCPRRDDEALCGLTCPPGCACQGHAFLCPRPFPAHSFPALRYLDATGSNMDLDDLTNNTYLVWLRLAAGNIQTVLWTSFPNLQSLDLSRNQLKTVSSDFLASLPNLKELVLSGNPLVSLFLSSEASLEIAQGGALGSEQLDSLSEEDLSVVAKGQLQKMDLSESDLPVFNCSALLRFSQLQALNLSHGRVSLTITEPGFQCNPGIREVDLRGTHVQQSPFRLFDGLGNIEVIYSDDYRHCCSHTLPPTTSNTFFCFAPASGISSCEDLLRFDLHRVTVWIAAMLSPLVNGAFLVARFLKQTETRGSSTQILLNHLGVANVLVGIYHCVIAAADFRFRGDFILHETSWLRSLTCQWAGAVFMAVTEASSFFISLLALDRFLCLCRGLVDRLNRVVRPSLHGCGGPGLGKTSSWVACFVSWVAAVSLSGAPLVLSGTEKGSGVYSRTGLCFAMPSLSASLPGHGYSFAILAVLNPLLATAAAYWQLAAYLDVRAEYIIACEKNPRSRDMLLSLRLLGVVVAEALCWWLVGAVGLMTSLGVTIPGADVIVVALVLPLRPLLQPALYGVGVLMERRRLRREVWLVTLHSAQSRAKKAVNARTNGTSSKTGAVDNPRRVFSSGPLAYNHEGLVSREQPTRTDDDLRQPLTRYDDVIFPKKHPLAGKDGIPGKPAAREDGVFVPKEPRAYEDDVLVPPTCKDDVISLLKRSLRSGHISFRDVSELLTLREWTQHRLVTRLRKETSQPTA